MNILNPLTETSFPLLTDLLLDARLLTCHKFFYDEFDDRPEVAVHVSHQELDGDVYLELSNGKTIVFSANTEDFSVKFAVADELRAGARDLSEIPFWKSKIGKSICGVELLFSVYRANPVGLRIKQEQDLAFSLIYKSDTAFTFDALVIK